MKEVIRKVGDKWVLFSSDGKKKLDEFDTKEKAQKRERQIQFFKHKKAARRLTAAELVERKKHTAAWHRCWSNVKKKYSDRTAAAICTWSVKRSPNPPNVYESVKLQEAEVLLTLDDAHEIDEVLAAEMELRGILGIKLSTETWEAVEIFEDGREVNPAEPVPAEEYTPQFEAVRQALTGHGLLEVGSRHTRREFQIIEQVIRLMAELHGEVESLDELLAQVEEAVRDYGGSAMVALYLPAPVAQMLVLPPETYPERMPPEDLHVALVYLGEIVDIEASKEDVMRALAQIAGEEPFLQGRINGAGRFLYTGQDGQTALYANVDCKTLPQLRQRISDTLGWKNVISPSEHGFIPHVTLTYLPVDAPTPDVRPLADVVFDALYLVWGGEKIRFELQGQVASETTQAVASARRSHPLTDVWDRSLTEARIDDTGNLSGLIVVEGLSANGNYYTPEALESGIEIFAGKPIYADHPTRTEERERPERSVRDLVGRLPGREGMFVEPISETDTRLALKYRGARLSETAGWLATLIREKIAGDQSINASGQGQKESTQFKVEAFTDATSLDFVTQAAAGGQAFLESQRTPIEVIVDSSLSFEQLVEARPDIVDTIAARERRKAYGEKRELFNLREVHRMSKSELEKLRAENAQLKATLAASRLAERQRKAGSVVNGVLAEAGLPATAQTRIRRLVEADVRRFVEQDGGGEAPPIEVQPPGELAPAATDANPGDPPKLELPPDVAGLPEEAQGVWLETYTAHLAEGEEMAVHKAWAAVAAAGWVKDEGSGQWGQMLPEDVAGIIADATGGESVAPPAAPPAQASATEEALRKAVRQAVLSERVYLAQVSGAGRITGMGGGAPQQLTEAQQAEKEEERREQSYRNMGLTEAEAKIAVKGR